MNQFNENHLGYDLINLRNSHLRIRVLYILTVPLATQDAYERKANERGLDLRGRGARIYFEYI